MGMWSGEYAVDGEKDGRKLRWSISYIVVLVLKEQVKGQVKTRLAQNIGEDAAAAVYLIMVQHIFKELAGLPVIVSLKSQLNNGPIQKICRTLHIPVYTQPKGDLGTAIYHACSLSHRSLILGGDMPLIPQNDIRCALASMDLCIGPSEDGGY